MTAPLLQGSTHQVAEESRLLSRAANPALILVLRASNVLALRERRLESLLRRDEALVVLSSFETRDEVDQMRSFHAASL